MLLNLSFRMGLGRSATGFADASDSSPLAAIMLNMILFYCETVGVERERITRRDNIMQ